MVSANKISWSSVVTSVQPRIRLTRSFDQRTHSYLGYVLRVDGTIGTEIRELGVAIGDPAQVEHQFRIGDHVDGDGVPVADPRTELAELYKVSKLRVHERGMLVPTSQVPPWHGVPPTLPIYRERGAAKARSPSAISSANMYFDGQREGVGVAAAFAVADLQLGAGDRVADERIDDMHLAQRGLGRHERECRAGVHMCAGDSHVHHGRRDGLRAETCRLSKGCDAVTGVIHREPRTSSYPTPSGLCGSSNALYASARALRVEARLRVT